MKETLRGSAETRELLKMVLTKYPGRGVLSETCHYSISYISYLCTGKRIASKSFLEWVKTTHPDLGDFCIAVQMSKVMD